MSNFLSAVLGLLNINLSTRALGPENLGQFDFANQSNTLLISFLSLGLGPTFFNWMSKEKQSKALAGVMCYSVIVVAIFAMHILLVAGSSAAGLQSHFWPGLPGTILVLGIVFSELTFALQASSFWSDGQAHTVGAEWIKLLISVLRSALIAALFFAGSLSLVSFYYIQIAVLALNLALLLPWLWRKSEFSRYLPEWRLHLKDFVTHLKVFGGPLLIYGWLGVGYEYLDTWLLQYVGGAVEQGYFGFSNRLAGVIFLFSSALTPLFTREITNAHHTQNQEYFDRLFQRIRIPVAVTSIIGCFGAVFAPHLSRSLGGAEFESTALTVALMSLYPIHQTFSQLVSSVFFATGRTRTYARFGIVNLLIGMCVTYFVLAPKSGGGFPIPGLGLGSLGLAIKLVGVQFVTTNITLFFAVRVVKKDFFPWLGFQLEMIGVPVVIAFFAKWVSENAVGGVREILIPYGQGFIGYTTLAVGAVVYGLVGLGFISLRPQAFGLTKAELIKMIRRT